jgi:two-component system response regulator YesN
MFKVLIIDDEPIIRKGIKNIVNWNQFGCEVCGEAGDGLAGRELIEKILPDIIITDIRMPEVDGLSMISEIRNIVPDSKVIILTGYRDFDYAHESIKLGAFDYLLKPTKIEELNAVVSRAVKELRFKLDKNAEMEKMRRTYEKHLPLIKEKLLYNMMCGLNGDGEGSFSQAEQLGIKIGNFVFGIVENDKEESKGKDFAESQRLQESQFYQYGIISTVEEVFSDVFEVFCISLNLNRTAFLLQNLSGSTVSDNQEKINTKCVYLQEIIKNCFGFTVSIALSSPGNGYKELPEKLRECREALEHKFYLGVNSIIFYKDLGPFFKYTDYSELTDRQKALFDNIRSGNFDAVQQSLSAIIECVNNLGNFDREYIKNFYFSTITQINSIKTSLAKGDNDPEGNVMTSLYIMIEKCENVVDLNAILENAANRTVEKVHEFNSNNMKLLLRKALDYIGNHYFEQITLNQVAENLYVSPFYVSRMFKKEQGINFVDYLNELRINKAKELLADARYKTYEVAQAVGVPDSHYFSKLFRKYAGMTASEYRESVIR